MNDDLQAARMLSAQEAVRTARNAARYGAGAALVERLELRARAVILGLEDSAQRDKLTDDLDHGHARRRDWLAKPEDPMDEQAPTETKTLETLTCDTCGKTCRGPAGLSSHLKTHAPKPEAPEGSPKTEQPSSSRRRGTSTPQASPRLAPEAKLSAAEKVLSTATPNELLSIAMSALGRLTPDQRTAALAWLAATCGSDERGRA